MVGPARKREAVAHLVEECDASQRRACKVVRKPRSTNRYAPKRSDEEDRLKRRLKEISDAEPRWGYRTAASQLRRESWRINDERVQRLWREEGLKVPQRQRKRRRLGKSANSSQRQRASEPRQVWSYDFVMDQTSDGRRLKLLCVVDEYTRECLAIHLEAKVLSAEWRRNYNERRPHSALGDLTPVEFAARWRAPVGATPLPTHASAGNQKP